jgi:MoxR-like ATPase
MNSTLSLRAAEIRQEIRKVIIGQETLIEKTLIALLAGGHVILEGVPGLAKTLFARALAATLHVSFRRIQFTPDLMPSDITGTDIIEEDASGHRAWTFVPGPIFSNFCPARFSATSCSRTKSTARRRRRSRRCSRRWRNTR